MARLTSPSLCRVLFGVALLSASSAGALGCAAAEDTADPLRPVVDAAPNTSMPDTSASDNSVPDSSMPDSSASDSSASDGSASDGSASDGDAASAAPGSAGMNAAVGAAPARVEFPLPTVPARTAAVEPSEQPAVDAFRAAWEAIVGFYSDLDVAAVEPVRTLSDDLVEVWVAELTRWRERGAVSGSPKADAASWQRIEAIRRLDAETVELEYCSFVNLELRDASGAVVLDGNSFVSREIAVMKQQEGQWFWSTTYNAAPVAGELVRDCAWR